MGRSLGTNLDLTSPTVFFIFNELMSTSQFVIASPGHASIYDAEALALHKLGLLHFIAMGTRRGVDDLPAEFTRLKPAIGLCAYVAAKTMSSFAAESFRFRLYPWLDRWVKKQLRPGDCIISSYAYANASFQWVQANGGKTFLDGGNSHPDNFWELLTEEHRRWKSPYPPVARHYYERSRAMMEHVDYVFTASNYVAQSFLARGFKPEQLLPHPRPLNLAAFRPIEHERPRNKPLTLIHTGAICLRKGTPYLLEAVRLIQKKIPNVRLLMRDTIREDMKEILKRYNDLPITWLGWVPHRDLAKSLQEADIFILPSLEEGMVLTAVEAMGCGLPVILTPNCGANDLVQSGVSGEVVPIRDPQAIAEAVFKWAEKIFVPGYRPRVTVNKNLLTFEHFEEVLIGQLKALGLLPRRSYSEN
jgi:glycosyltransferase involved in cell wall biosynthesis